MIDKIKEHLKSIRSEVGEVHPLLESLFQRMGSISHIEYKQGPSEDGADFVLEKYDDMLDSHEYIGVVVKKDGITKSSHDVLRQIEECIHTSRVVHGKKTIMLDEIWVITPGNITISAQEFFSAKFKSSKIKFIGSEKLSALISKYIPDYFSGISAGANNYILRCKERLVSASKNSHLSFNMLDGVSVEQDLIPVEKLRYKENSM